MGRPSDQVALDNTSEEKSAEAFPALTPRPKSTLVTRRFPTPEESKQFLGAVQRGHLQQAKQALQKALDAGLDTPECLLEDWDAQGDRAIHLALRHSRFEVAKWLLNEKRVHVCVFNLKGEYPLDVAEKAKAATMVRLVSEILAKDKNIFSDDGKVRIESGAVQKNDGRDSGSTLDPANP